MFLDGAPATLGLTGTHSRLPREFDVALTFHTTTATLTRRLPQLIERMATAGMIWVCWPKRASKVPTDLDGNVVRELGLSHGGRRREGRRHRRGVVGSEVRTTTPGSLKLVPAAAQGCWLPTNLRRREHPPATDLQGTGGFSAWRGGREVG